MLLLLESLEKSLQLLPVTEVVFVSDITLTLIVILLVDHLYLSLYLSIYLSIYIPRPYSKPDGGAGNESERRIRAPDFTSLSLWTLREADVCDSQSFWLHESPNPKP